MNAGSRALGAYRIATALRQAGQYTQASTAARMTGGLLANATLAKAVPTFLKVM